MSPFGEPLPKLAPPDGWRCPGCGACFAPWMAACMHCTPRPAQVAADTAGEDAPLGPAHTADDTARLRALAESLLPHESVAAARASRHSDAQGGGEE